MMVIFNIYSLILDVNLDSVPSDGIRQQPGHKHSCKGEKKGFYLWAELCLVRCPTVMGRLAAPHFIQANFFPENWVQSAGGGPQPPGSSRAPRQQWGTAVAGAHLPFAR